MATFAFIHGAGDVGWYWHLVEAELRRIGHDTVAPDLPIDDDAAGLTRYADVVVDAVGDRRDVVVVAQSFGGYIAPIVADRIGARLIVLVAAMVPSPGESADEMFANTAWQPEQLEDSSAHLGLLSRCPARARQRGPERAAGANPRRPAGSHGRLPRGPTSRPGSSSAGTTGSSRRVGCGHWFATGLASSPTRSTAVTARR